LPSEAFIPPSQVVAKFKEFDSALVSVVHELNFHLQLLELFVSINKGASERVHAKMRGSCSLDDVIAALHNEFMLPPCFESLCSYLSETFLLSDLEDDVLNTSTDVANKLLSAWELMVRKFNTTFADNANMTPAAIAHQRCIVSGILPCCVAYVRKLGFERAELVLKSVQQPKPLRPNAGGASNGEEGGPNVGAQPELAALRNNNQLVEGLLEQIVIFERHGLNNVAGLGSSTGSGGEEGPFTPAEMKGAIHTAKNALQTCGQVDQAEAFQLVSRRRSAHPVDETPLVLKKFDAFVQTTLRSEFIQQRVSAEFDLLASAIESVQRLTDPHEVTYQRASAVTKKNDTRKNAISFEELLARIIRHLRAPEQMEQMGSVGPSYIDEQELRVAMLVLLRRLIERQLRYGEWTPSAASAYSVLDPYIA
jgi:hypothetical protein